MNTLTTVTMALIFSRRYLEKYHLHHDYRLAFDIFVCMEKFLP